jgi:hypothetical protein
MTGRIGQNILVAGVALPESETLTVTFTYHWSSLVGSADYFDADGDL